VCPADAHSHFRTVNSRPGALLADGLFAIHFSNTRAGSCREAKKANPSFQTFDDNERKSESIPFTAARPSSSSCPSSWPPVAHELSSKRYVLSMIVEGRDCWLLWIDGRRSCCSGSAASARRPSCTHGSPVPFHFYYLHPPFSIQSANHAAAFRSVTTLKETLAAQVPEKQADLNRLKKEFGSQKYVHASSLVVCFWAGRKSKHAGGRSIPMNPRSVGCSVCSMS
jgi:hypothetical protein